MIFLSCKEPHYRVRFFLCFCSLFAFLSDARSYDCNCADNDKQACIIDKNISIRALRKRLYKLVQPHKHESQPHCRNVYQCRTKKQIFDRKSDCHFICHDSYEYDNCARQFMPVTARIISVSPDQVKNTVHYCHYRIYNTINECALLQPVIPCFPHLNQAPSFQQIPIRSNRRFLPCRSIPVLSVFACLQCILHFFTLPIFMLSYYCPRSGKGPAMPLQFFSLPHPAELLQPSRPAKSLAETKPYAVSAFITALFIASLITNAAKEPTRS